MVSVEAFRDLDENRAVFAILIQEGGGVREFDWDRELGTFTQAAGT